MSEMAGNWLPALGLHPATTCQYAATSPHLISAEAGQHSGKLNSGKRLK
jgi:hypothetical protein